MEKPPSTIVPGVMIKFTDIIYITACPQVADRRCLLGEGELSDYDTTDWTTWTQHFMKFQKEY
jgi:hypothetical protein